VKPLPFDFRFGNQLVEYDGEQHFHPVSRGGSKEKAQKKLQKQQLHDTRKNRFARDNGYHLVRFDYTCTHTQIREELEKLIHSPKTKFIGKNY
jgi:hypothetical protein